MKGDEVLYLFIIHYNKNQKLKSSTQIFHLMLKPKKKQLLNSSPSFQGLQENLAFRRFPLDPVVKGQVVKYSKRNFK